MKLTRKQLRVLIILSIGQVVFAGGALHFFNHWAFPSKPIPVPCCTGTFYSPSNVDAWWFVIQTITTTGYGSLPVWTNRLKILSSILMIGSILMWTVFLGLVINIIHDYLKGDGRTKSR
ncbi:ion transporter [Patescibacteria group bacterium]|nr:ion transporter [Patescibacteria group bacterium]